MSNIVDLEQSLLAAFSDSQDGNTQAEEYMWAILEGLSRTEWGKRWHEEVADHPVRCSRSCAIPMGEMYFSFSANRDRQLALPFCARCVAMILYAQRVWTLAPVLHVGWDRDEGRPVRAGVKTMAR